MKLYSREKHRNVEKVIHFGIGKSVKTVCGVVMFSRHALVSVFSDWDGALITDNMKRVTCKRCLSTRDTRLRKILAIEQENPGIFDHDTLCGEKWLLDHALSVSQQEVDNQQLEIINHGKSITLSNNQRARDRKYILKQIVRPEGI